MAQALPISKDLVLLELDKLRGKFNAIVDRLDQARKEIQQIKDPESNEMSATYRRILTMLQSMDIDSNHL